VCVYKYTSTRKVNKRSLCRDLIYRGSAALTTDNNCINRHSILAWLWNGNPVPYLIYWKLPQISVFISLRSNAEVACWARRL